MDLLAKYGNKACVLGAAEGLGAAFSKALAGRGFHLILIDKKKEDVERLGVQLSEKYQIECTGIYLDLSERANAGQVVRIMEAEDCRFVVCNAAYGPVKPFLSHSSEELDLYLKLNVEFLLHLSYGFILKNKNRTAGMLLLSSLAGFRGTRYVVPYAATKAFIWNFAEGLYHEFRNSPFDISVCCPGPTDTPNYRSTRPQRSWLTPTPMPPEKVAEEALDRFGKKLFIIPGFSNRLAHFVFKRLLSHHSASTIHNYAMGKMYGDRIDDSSRM